MDIRYIINHWVTEWMESGFDMSNKLKSLIIDLGSRLFKSNKGSVLEDRDQLKVLGMETHELIREVQALQYSNRVYRESLEHIMTLYRFINTPYSETSIGYPCSSFAHYASNLTKSSLAFVWIAESHEVEIGRGKEGQIWLHKDTDIRIKNTIKHYLAAQWNSIQNQDKPMVFDIRGMRFLAMNIRSAVKNYGILGVQTEMKCQDYELCIAQLPFLSDFLGAILEDQDHRKAENRLIIIGEQNRIANEIHDTVSQRLFSLVCSITTITRIYGKENHELKVQLELLRRSVDQAMTELRSIIYNLSSRKRGIKPFSSVIKEYLDNMGRLHSIVVSASITGNEDIISGRLKRAIYRIICEGTGNAVRHGNCQHLEVTLSMEHPYTSISIVDDGRGFDTDSVSKSMGIGLGLRNMESLVYSFNGEFYIDSKLGRQTRIQIRIPASIEYSENVEGSAI